MSGSYRRLVAATLLLGAFAGVAMAQGTSAPPAKAQSTQSSTTDVTFAAHDGVGMHGRLVLPKNAPPRAIVLYVQTAEGMTIDQRRPLGEGKTFNYFDLYRGHLPERGIGFFSYEGRGIRMGDDPPRYEVVDREVFNTSTLDNKVRDALSAIAAVRSQPGLAEVPVFLMGASEGTLIAAEAASRQPDTVQGLILYGVLAANMKANFAYIMTGGDFLRYLPLDKDNDHAISKEEWEAHIKETPFAKADLNGDGAFTEEDLQVANKAFLDAIAQEDFATLDAWAKTSAGVALPENWFKDHFAHAEIGSFVAQLEVPIGIFHGDRDNYASMAAVKQLEQKTKEAGLENVTYHYFGGLNHSLNIEQYFLGGEIPEGHEAIFKYIDRIAPQAR